MRGVLLIEGSALSELMTPEEFLSKREAYSYPAVGIDGTIEAWARVPSLSTWQMDRHHQELLISIENTRVVMGYVSTVFWGHFSGQDGKIREERARSVLSWRSTELGMAVEESRVVRRRSGLPSST